MLKILCIPLNAKGHINPLIGLTSALKARGHTITFATQAIWETKLKDLGFEVEVYENGEEEDPATRWEPIMNRLMDMLGKDSFETYDALSALEEGLLTDVQQTNGVVNEIIQKIKPDLILYENIVWHPAVVTADIPIVYLAFPNPLCALEGGDLIPPFFGLSIHCTEDQRAKYQKRRNSCRQKFITSYNAYATLNGVPALAPNRTSYTSNNLNIYLYPRKLAEDYIKRSPYGKHWIGLDCIIRPTDSLFEIPEDFKKMAGKTVFISLGTIGSLLVDLMKRLVDMCRKAKPKYKFIFSKGPLGDQLTLPDNVIGENYLPQLGVLPQVDLAIIHGGNNTFTETVYFGKPMIVVPLFYDQLDNAQRAVDAKIGAKFDICNQSEDDLIQLMDAVLNDDALINNVQRLSKEIQERNPMAEIIDRIEEVAKAPKTPSVIEFKSE